METLKLHIRCRAPPGRACTGGLVNLEVGDRVLAQAIPVPLHVPRRANHGSGLVPGPEAAYDAATQLVAMLIKDARKLHDAGIASSIVGRLWSGPGILVTTNDHKVICLTFDFSNSDLYRSPAVFDIGAHPDPHWSLLQQFAQLQARRPRNTDAGQRRHLALECLRSGITPHRLYRAKRDRGIFRVPPVHHHATCRTKQPRDALLLMARGMV